MAAMKVTLGSGGGGHEAPGGQRGDEEHAAARSANISAAAMVARGPVIWLTVLGRAVRVIGCDGASILLTQMLTTDLLTTDADDRPIRAAGSPSPPAARPARPGRTSA